MRKTLDQLMRENPLLQTYLALGGKYHFDSRDIVLMTPGIPEETIDIFYFEEGLSNWDAFILKHISHMEEQLYRQHEYEMNLMFVDRERLK